MIAEKTDFYLTLLVGETDPLVGSEETGLTELALGTLRSLLIRGATGVHPLSGTPAYLHRLALPRELEEKSQADLALGPPHSDITLLVEILGLSEEESYPGQTLIEAQARWPHFSLPPGETYFSCRIKVC